MTSAIEYLGVLMPQLILLTFALVAPALDLWLKMRRGIAYWCVIGMAIVAVIEVLALIPDTSHLVSFLDWQNAPHTELFELNAFSKVFTLVFLFVGILVALSSPDFISKEKNHGEYYALLMIAVTGMSFVAIAADLIVIFIGIEIASISSYALTGFQKSLKRSSEAAMKYFIVGGFSSAMTLFGISFIYGAGGSTNIGFLSASLSTSSPFALIAMLGIVMLIVGLGFKIAAVPFHMWAPDVYEGAPTPITALLAAGSKKMGFAALFKIFLVVLILFKADWELAFAVISILTMTVGNLIAIQQTSVKRMLAYSSIAQVGYILIAFPVASQYAVAGGILHVVTHSAMKSGAFFILVAMAVAGLGEKLEDFNGLKKRSPFLAFAMAIFVLSLAGIPPLAGFYSKFILFSAPIFSAQGAPGSEWLVWLAVAGILNSALSLFYYARIIKRMYVHDANNSERIRIAAPLKAAILIALVATILIGLYPQPFIDMALTAAEALNGILPLGR